MTVCPRSKLQHAHHSSFLMCRVEKASRYVAVDHLVHIIYRETKLL